MRHGPNICSLCVSKDDGLRPFLFTFFESLILEGVENPNSATLNTRSNSCNAEDSDMIGTLKFWAANKGAREPTHNTQHTAKISHTHTHTTRC